MLSVSKDLKQSEGRLQRQEGNYGPSHTAIELDGALLALIGLGRIGSGGKDCFSDGNACHCVRSL